MLVGVGLLLAGILGLRVSHTTGMDAASAIVLVILGEVFAVGLGILVARGERRRRMSRRPPEDPPLPDDVHSEPQGFPINGVFMGGGARGVVYAGALSAVSEAGFSFHAVAGSSAGAITAALVAARLTPSQFRIAARQALRHVTPRPFAGLIPYSDKSLFSVTRLGKYLEKLLRQQVSWLGKTKRTADHDVTFRELYEVSGIELDIVAMDLATQQPVVFNYVTAPYCQVSEAVLASCAIPGGMRSRRLSVLERGVTPRVHRLVDGGAWANYPEFVFRSSSFREYWGLGPAPATVTVGFALDKEPELRSASRRDRFLRMKSPRGNEFDRGSGSEASPLGTFLNWPLVRFIALVILPLVIVSIMVSWLIAQLHAYFTIDTPVAFDPSHITLILALFFALSAFVFLAGGFLLFLWRLGRELFDVGLPAMFAAMSVGVGLPRWIGTGRDHAVLLHTPHSLKTTSFTVSDDLVDAVVKVAEYDTKLRLNTLWPRRFARPPGERPFVPERRLANWWDTYAPYERVWIAGFFGSWALAILVGITDWGVDGIAYATTPGHGWRVAGAIALLGATSCGMLALGLFVRVWSQRRLPRTSRIAGPVAGAFVLVIASGALLTSAYNSQPFSPSSFGSASRYEGQVVRSESSDSRWIINVVSPEFEQDWEHLGAQYCQHQDGTCIVFETWRTANARVGADVTVLQIPGWEGFTVAGDEYHVTLGRAPMLQYAFGTAAALSAAACVRTALKRRRLALAVETPKG